MNEKCPVCLDRVPHQSHPSERFIHMIHRIFMIRKEKSMDNEWLVFPFCKHAICFSCGINIIKHTPGNTNIRCPLCRCHMLHGVKLGP